MSTILLKLPKDNKRFNPFPGIGGILVGSAIRDFLVGIVPNEFHYFFHSRTKNSEWSRTVKHITQELGFVQITNEYGNKCTTFIGNEGKICIQKVTHNAFYPEKLLTSVMFTLDQFAARGPDILTTLDCIDDLKKGRVNISTSFKGDKSTITEALKTLENKGFIFDEQYFAYITAKNSRYGI